MRGEKTEKGQFWCWRNWEGRRIAVSVYEPHKYREDFSCPEEIDVCARDFLHAMDLKKLPLKGVAWLIEGRKRIRTLRLKDVKDLEDKE